MSASETRRGRREEGQEHCAEKYRWEVAMKRPGRRVSAAGKYTAATAATRAAMSLRRAAVRTLRVWGGAWSRDHRPRGLEAPLDARANGEPRRKRPRAHKQAGAPLDSARAACASAGCSAVKRRRLDRRARAVFCELPRRLRNPFYLAPSPARSPSRNRYSCVRVGEGPSCNVGALTFSTRTCQTVSALILK
eukprot:134159-Pleurochrysis_carterae.AAC.3